VALARPDSYPHHPQTVEVRETHISWVFLAGEWAYKLKKPIALPFLDYGTAARRREMCREEVRLNRRLAPDIYLGVRGVAETADGVELTADNDSRAIDYVVEMRRYDEDQTLAAILDRGELTRSQVRRVARKLAGFHAHCEHAATGEGGAHRIEREVDRNAEELLELAEDSRERAQIRDLARFMSAFVSGRAPEFDARAGRELIRECHGDLRAEHVLLRPRVRIVDCVEFDADLRTLDVADDLAFLVMDLAALGGDRFAGELIRAYRAAGGDCGEHALVAFFAAHRALVRAKVLLVRVSQRPLARSIAAHASTQVRGLLALAESCSWRARLPLVLIVCGVPASGKSYLAGALAELSRLPHVSSDLTRKRLVGVLPRERAPSETYGPEWNARTYAELGEFAARAVAAQGGAVVDATFRYLTDREAFRQAFGGAAAAVFVECLAPPSVLVERAIRRTHDPHNVSDADRKVVARERASWQPLDEVPASAHLPVRTDRALEGIIEDVRAFLDARIGPMASSRGRAPGRGLD
jgi:aminoglycoside phosphotransferase family enzyme/predicted kinase